MTAAPTPQASKPFTFDAAFGDGGSRVESRKRVYLAEEVDRVRERAFQEGEASVTARAAEAQAEALRDLANAAREGLTALARAALDHRTACADVTLAAAKTIAAGALERFPEAPIRVALERLDRELEAQPRLVVRMGGLDDEARARVEAAITEMGFTGQVAFRDDPSAPLASFALEWADGRALYSSDEVSTRIAEAFQAAIAAEGLHGEPTIKGS